MGYQEKIKNPKEIIEYYDSISEGYDELYSEEQRQKFMLIQRELNSLISNKKLKTLDLGAGTGISLEFFDGEMTLLEPSAKLLDKSKIKALIHKKQNIEFFLGGDESLEDFEDKEFNLILCVSVAHHFKKKEEAIQEIKRITKKEGIIVFSLLKNAESTPEFLKILKKEFSLIKEIQEQKDIIIILKKE